jgi:hypothetical protein
VPSVTSLLARGTAPPLGVANSSTCPASQRQHRAPRTPRRRRSPLLSAAAKGVGRIPVAAAVAAAVGARACSLLPCPDVASPAAFISGQLAPRATTNSPRPGTRRRLAAAVTDQPGVAEAAPSKLDPRASWWAAQGVKRSQPAAGRWGCGGAGGSWAPSSWLPLGVGAKEPHGLLVSCCPALPAWLPTRLPTLLPCLPTLPTCIPGSTHAAP